MRTPGARRAGVPPPGAKAGAVVDVREGGAVLSGRRHGRRSLTPLSTCPRRAWASMHPSNEPPAGGIPAGAAVGANHGLARGCLREATGRAITGFKRLAIDSPCLMLAARRGRWSRHVNDFQARTVPREYSMRRRSKSSWQKWAVILTAVGLLFGATGCQKSPKDKLRTAQGYVMSGTKLDKAETMLKDVLESDAGSTIKFRAHRQLALIYSEREEHARAEEQLEKLWKETGLDGEELTNRQRSQERRLEDQFLQLYKNWSEKLQEEGNNEKMVEVAKKGLEYDEADTTLNRMLVDHFWETGKSLVDKGDKKKAAESFEEILQLRTTRERRNEAQTRAREIRRELFKKRGMENFNEKVKPKLGGMEGFELNDKTIAIDYDVEVNRQLQPNNEKHATMAKQKALLQLMGVLGNKIAAPIAGLPEGADLTIIDNQTLLQVLPANLKELKVDFNRGEVNVAAKLPVESAIAMGSDLKDAYKSAKEAKEKAEAEKKKAEGDEKGKEGDEKKGDEKKEGGDKESGE